MTIFAKLRETAAGTEVQDVQWVDLIPARQGGIKLAIFTLLCLALVSFPFSVAATNATLGLALALGMLSGQWVRGAALLWQHERRLTICMLVYLAFTPLGLLWSQDLSWGLHVLGRQWFWFLIPVLVAVLEKESWRDYALVSLSVGLTLHLAFCVLQMYGLVTVTTWGSSALDATGHIGHIGFGAVYGIWAAWLLYWFRNRSDWLRWPALLLACWSWVMIFMALGRSGYLVAIVLLMLVLWRILFRGHIWRSLLLAGGILLLMGVVLTSGQGKTRLAGTWDNVQSILDGRISGAGPRWSMWVGAVDAWKKHPLLGVGTGGFPAASELAALENPELNYGKPEERRIRAAHPHNIYLLSLARWSVWGLASLLLFLFVWFRTGWVMQWSRSRAGPLIALPAMAVMVHGLSAPSLEEHFLAILAVLLLGAGLAERSQAGREVNHGEGGSQLVP